MSDFTTVLLVDENDDFLDAIEAWLQEEIGGLMFVRAHSMVDALEKAAAQHPQLIIADSALPDGNGIRIARFLAPAAPDAAVLLLTLYDNYEVLVEARSAGVDVCIAKTAVMQKLVPAVRRLLAAHSAAARRRADEPAGKD